MTGTLFVLGIALLAAAFIGGGLKVANIEIPVISTKVGGIGLATAGLLAIGLGYQAHYWDSRNTQQTAATDAAPDQPSPTSQQGGVPPTESVTMPSTQPSSMPTDPSVFYQGTLTFTTPGYDLDLNPPKPVDGETIESLDDGELYTGTESVLLAEWDQQQTPNKAACGQQINQRGGPEVTDLVVGNVVCVRTAHGHTARLTVDSVGTTGLVMQVTVWK